MTLRTSLGRAALALFAGLALASSALAQTGAIGRAPATGGLPGTYAVGDLLCASSTSALGRLAAPAVGQVLKSNGVGACPSWSASPSLSSLDLSSTGKAVSVPNAASYLIPQYALSGYNTGVGLGNNGDIYLTSIGIGVATFKSSGGLPIALLKSSAQFGWSSADINGSADLALYRGGAGILEQRNGANAQTFNLVRSWTDASNNEGLVLTNFAGLSEISTYANGTGSASTLYVGTRGNAPLILMTANGGRWSLNASGHFAPQTDAIYDIGALNVKVRTTYVNSVVNNNGALTLRHANTDDVRIQPMTLANPRLGFYNSTAVAQGVIETTADGVFTISNGARNDFSLLRGGGVTSAFPAWKRSGAAWQSRLADDSAFTAVQGKLTTDTAYTAGDPTTTGYLLVYDSTGTAYRVPALLN